MKIRELVNPQQANAFYLIEMKDGTVMRISRKGMRQYFKGPVPKVRTITLPESHHGRD